MGGVEKLSFDRFPAQAVMRKDDYLLVCGDFGFVWNSKSWNEFKWRMWFEAQRYTTLFIDGNHENFDDLSDYDVEMWNGGKVHIINNSIIHLMRGQIFNIDDATIFTMGGAKSIDRDQRELGASWWLQEEPSKEEYDEACDNLLRANYEVDYVVTHTCPTSLVKKISKINFDDPVSRSLEYFFHEIKYKKWYFGHFHQDIDFGKQRLLFNDVIPLGE